MPTMQTTGYLLMIGSWFWLVISTYTMILSKLLSAPQHPILKAIAADRHYCLIPSASVVVAVGCVFFNWLGLKYFRHN